MLTALIVGVLGAVIEIVLLRRIYRAPELFQLLATFALVLVINDAALCDLGPGGSARAARAGHARRDRYPRPTVAELRPVPDRDRPAVLMALQLAACAHALRPAGARGDAGPRDGRRARRQSGGAVHRGVCPRRGACRARRRAAARRASRPISPWTSPRSATRSSSSWSAAWARITGAYVAAVLIAEVKALCIAHRRRQFRLCRCQFLQADAGRRVPGHGGGADRAAVGPARPAAGAVRRPPSLRSRCARRRAVARSAGAALLVLAACAAAAGARLRLTCSCSASTC